MELYRFRKLQNAKLELDNYRILFADRKDLNDPIEGYARVYWQGDTIAWKCLFRNFIDSLYNTLTLVLLCKENIFERNVIFLPLENAPLLEEKLREIETLFLGLEGVKKIINHYGGNGLKCGKKELESLLYCVHPMAYAICLEKQIESGFVSEELRGFEQISDKQPRLEEISNAVCALNEQERCLFLSEVAKVYEEFSDMLLYRVPDEPERVKRNWFAVRAQFPKQYVSNLEEMLHPEQYIVCFSKTDENSVMWGNYADNHKGICWIFDTKERDGKEYLSIGQLGEEQKEGVPFRELHVKAVQYDNAPPSINFFTMLGRLNRRQLSRFLIDEDGERSEKWNEYFGSEEAWRSDYWKKCEDRYCIKMREWEYEKECRILVSNTFYDLSDWESRLLRFDFKEVKGIIFGIKTPMDEKYKMINLLKEKCAQEKRTDFVFYQAEYSEEKNCVIKRKMVIDL